MVNICRDSYGENSMSTPDGRWVGRGVGSIIKEILDTLSFFFISDAVHAVSRPMVARLQTETHLLLLEHISCYHPREVTRYGSLLMLINILKTMCVKSTIVS